MFKLFRSSKSFLNQHKNDLITGIIASAVVASIFSQIPSQYNTQEDTQERISNADLRIVDIVVSEASSPQPVLDIKLMNRGDGTAFLTEVVAVVIKSEPTLGIVEPAATYDLLISSERNVLKLSHEIKPNSAERFIIKLGASRWYSASYVQFYLELIYNGGEKIISEPIEVAFLDGN